MTITNEYKKDKDDFYLEVVETLRDGREITVRYKTREDFLKTAQLNEELMTLAEELGLLGDENI